MKTALLIGKLPPPIGGVTVSIRSEVESLRKANFEVTVFQGGVLPLIKLLFKRFDFAHVHARKPSKRLFSVLLGRLLSSRTIFTVHSQVIRTNSFMERMSLRWAHGVIILNENVERTYRDVFEKFKVRKALLTPLFAEGFDRHVPEEHFYDRQPGKRYLLLYAFEKTFEKGNDVYGVDFILNNLSRINANYQLVFLDPKGHYKSDVGRIRSERVIYFDRPVNFRALLRSVDVYIRPTYWDGNSVAIQESLAEQVRVVASDRVQRPKGVSVYRYGDFNDFMQKVENAEPVATHSIELSSVQDLISFVTQL